MQRIDFIVIGGGTVGLSVAWAACFYTGLVLIAVIESGCLHLAIFRLPPLRFLGLISYSLYLFFRPLRSLRKRQSPARSVSDLSRRNMMKVAWQFIVGVPLKGGFVPQG